MDPGIPSGHFTCPLASSALSLEVRRQIMGTKSKASPEAWILTIEGRRMDSSLQYSPSAHRVVPAFPVQ